MLIMTSKPLEIVVALEMINLSIDESIICITRGPFPLSNRFIVTKRQKEPKSQKEWKPAYLEIFLEFLLNDAFGNGADPLLNLPPQNRLKPK